MQPKAQHYVPQVYLRNFATQRKKEFFICCFDKATRKTFKPNVKNVANQTGFYNFINSEGEKASIESFFNDAETKMKYALQELNDKPTSSTLMAHREVIAKFFALQEERTLVFRDVHNDTIRLVNKRLKPDGFEFPEPTENDTREFQARFLIDMADSFTGVLLDLKWILVSNKTNMPFWTSDNPIAKYNPHKSELVGNLGWKSPGIQLHIPISPALAIIMCDPFEYADMAPELPAFAPSVDFNNSGQVIEAKQYVFSQSDDFSLAHKMLQELSELSNPNRPRITLAN
ncbi:MAG: DUF4238 domain-containing protein [Anaerolineales bacterium]